MPALTAVAATGALLGCQPAAVVPNRRLHGKARVTVVSTIVVPIKPSTATATDRGRLALGCSPGSPAEVASPPPPQQAVAFGSQPFLPSLNSQQRTKGKQELCRYVGSEGSRSRNAAMKACLAPYAARPALWAPLAWKLACTPACSRSRLPAAPQSLTQALDEPTDRLLRWAAVHDLSALDVAQLVSWPM